LELRLCVFILLVSFSAPIDLSDECRKPAKRVSSRELLLARQSVSRLRLRLEAQASTSGPIASVLLAASSAK